MSTSPAAPKKSGVPVRLILGLVLAGLLVWWILVNQGDVTVDFIVFTTTVGLWIALAIAAALGAVVGFLVGRKRYRTK